jgi:hypothetical protein
MATSKSAHIISSSHFKMETVIVQPKRYTRERFQQQAEIPAAKGGMEVTYPFQWMLFKPQAHAVPVFETNQPSRATNTQRVSGPTGPN